MAKADQITKKLNQQRKQVEARPKPSQTIPNQQICTNIQKNNSVQIRLEHAKVEEVELKYILIQ